MTRQRVSPNGELATIAGLPRRVCVACFAAFVFASGCGKWLERPGDITHNFSAVSASAKSGSQKLSAEGGSVLNTILDAGELPDLRLPGFKNYQAELKKFYATADNTLPWLRDSEPTPQALTIIQALKRAETRGLRPEDYDGPRWDERIESLHQRKPAPESDLVRFDVALTVSTMRYISDLHIGRVNPRLFHFGLDIDKKKSPCPNSCGRSWSMRRMSVPCSILSNRPSRHIVARLMR